MTDTSHVSQLSSANTAFGLSLYRQVCGGHDSNVFLSPFSISTALAMTFVGARGSTAQQMTSVLQWPAQLPVAQAFHQYLASSAGPECRLWTANRIYLNAGSHFLQEFLDATKTHFQAENTVANFSGDPNGERLKINKWVEEVTRQKIQDLIGEGALDPLTRMVLVNAIYFKGNWDTPFNIMNTKKSNFKLISGGEKVCDMMFMNKFLQFGLSERLQCSIVKLPYKGHKLSMVILVPQKDNGLPELEKSLTPQLLSDALNQTQRANVNLHLPKFSMESSFNLSDALSRLGMEDLFMEGKADLSGVNGGRDLFVSAALHKAFVEVNEIGTEAAAATCKLFGGGFCQVAHVNADHPFLFLITERESMILFMGRVMAP